MMKSLIMKRACALPWCYLPVFLLQLLCGTSQSVLIDEDLAQGENAMVVIEASDTLAQVGSSIRLTCSLHPGVLSARLYVKEDIRWYKKGINGDIDEVRAKINGTKSEVTLSNVTTDDSGNYTCCLNVSCLSPGDVQIRIGLPPRPASNLSCYSYNLKTPTCTWRRGGQGSNLKSTDVLMRSKGMSGWSPCSTNPALCNATYCQRVCANTFHPWNYVVNTTNDLGSALTSRYSFYASQDGTLNPPADIEVKNISATQLLVSWSLPEGLIATYHYRMVYTIEHRWEEDADWHKEEVRKDMEYNLRNLTHPYGLYLIRMRAKMSFGPRNGSRYSEVVRARTREVVPQDVGELHCKRINDSDMGEVVLIWKPLPNEFKQYGELLRYVITSSSAKGHEKKIVGENLTECTITDLNKDLQYSFCIQAENPVGISQKVCCKVAFVTSSSLVKIVLTVTITFTIITVLVFSAHVWIKKSMKEYPKIKPPPKIEDSNRYLPNGITSVNAREPEVFDDLVPCQLIVNLDPKQPNGPTIFNDIITDGFDIGDKPQKDFQMSEIGFESQPLLNLKVDLSNEAAALTNPLLDQGQNEDCVGSPVSVGYLNIGDDRSANGSMTGVCLSLHQNEGQPDTDAVDGLSRLNWRNEDVSEDDTSQDDRREDADSLKKHVKVSSPGFHPDKDGNVLGATYTGDESSLGYTKQGCLPLAAVHDVGNSYVQTDGPVPSYSRMGMLDGSTSHLATPHNTDLTQPDQSYPYQARSDETSAEPSLEQNNPPGECPEDGNIDSYVESALPSLGLLLDFPCMQNHGNAPQDVDDSDAQTGSAAGIETRTGSSQITDPNASSDTQRGQNGSPLRILPSQDQSSVSDESEEESTSGQCDDIASYAQNALPGLGQLLDFNLMHGPSNASVDLNVAMLAPSIEPNDESEENGLNYLTLDLGPDEDN